MKFMKSLKIVASFLSILSLALFMGCDKDAASGTISINFDHKVGTETLELESKAYQHIVLLDCSINSSMGVESTASIRVEIKGNEYSGTGAGNGGFAAFMDAIEKILQPLNFYLPKLKDFEVHIPRGGNTNALTETIITWETEERDMKTRGVDANQVFASIKAAMRMINVRMHANL